MYTVKQVSDLAGVSVRTLHYYDEIGLLRPSSVGGNGYRYYEETALFKLQQILFFREMDLGLLQIKEIVDSPEFDLVTALQTHRGVLAEKIDRLQGLISTVDSTIMHLAGGVEMSKQQLFVGFSEDKQKEYEQEVAEKYGKDRVEESVKRWASYSLQQKAVIQAEGGAIYRDAVNTMDKPVESAEVQTIMARWHEHIRNFYEPTPEILRGLGTMYNEHPDFNVFFQKFHQDLPVFLEKAIRAYCDRLE